MSKNFTYLGHKFSESTTTTSVRVGGREQIRWIIECDGPHGWRAGFHHRPTTIREAKELLRSRIEDFENGIRPPSAFEQWVDRQGAALRRAASNDGGAA